MGEWALAFFNNSLENGDFILYSEFVLLELGIKYDSEEIEKILEIVNRRNLLVKVEITGQQRKEAAILCKKRKVAFGDALHIILARDNNAIIITRDKHFLELEDISEIRKPENLI